MISFAYEKSTSFVCGGTCFLVTGKGIASIVGVAICCWISVFTQLLLSKIVLVLSLTFNFTCHPGNSGSPFPWPRPRRLMVTSQTWEVLSEMFFSEKKIPTTMTGSCGIITKHRVFFFRNMFLSNFRFRIFHEFHSQLWTCLVLFHWISKTCDFLFAISAGHRGPIGRFFSTCFSARSEPID